MRVTLCTGDARWTGSVGDTSAAGASVLFPADEAPTLPLGARLELTFSGGPLSEPVSVLGVLRSRAEGSFRRYGFAFDEPGRLGAMVPADAFGQFNRREWVRLAPDRPILVRIEVMDGPASGKVLEGPLADLSRGGMAVHLQPSAERDLGEALHLRCTVRPAGANQEQTCYVCLIRNRQVLEGKGGIRYGMEFVGGQPDVTPLAPPAYEPSWDCGACGTVRLLAQSHLFCPTCGASPRHDRTYFPSWDEVRTAQDHPFTGDERCCSACGARWAAAARHCGHCGVRL